MELVNQNNLVKIELKRLYDMLGDKLLHMEKINASRPDIRRVTNQYYEVKHLLRNYFDLDETGGNNGIEIACKIGDSY
jgi:hypothetical protein